MLSVLFVLSVSLALAACSTVAGSSSSSSSSSSSYGGVLFTVKIDIPTHGYWTPNYHELFHVYYSVNGSTNSNSANGIPFQVPTNTQILLEAVIDPTNGLGYTVYGIYYSWGETNSNQFISYGSVIQTNSIHLTSVTDDIEISSYFNAS
jgi:hypothetical protein